MPGPASRSKEQHGETTLVVELGAAASTRRRYLRDEARLQLPLRHHRRRLPRLGRRGRLRLHRHAGRPRPEHADDAGLPGRAARRSRSASRSTTTCSRSASAPRRVRLQTWVDEGEAVPSVIDVWPTADWHEREACDLMGIAHRRPPEPEADPPRRRLGRPPAAQGLPARRRAGALLGGASDGRRTEPRTRARSPIYEGTRIPRPIPTVLQTTPEMLATGDVMTVNFGPNHPSTHGVLRLDRRPLRRGRDRARGRDRLPAHRLREEHGAEDVVEVHHVPGAHRLRLVPEQRVRLRRARSRSCSSSRCRRRRSWMRTLPLRAEPHPLAPRLARHVGARARRDLDVLVRVPRARA